MLIIKYCLLCHLCAHLRLNSQNPIQRYKKKSIFTNKSQKNLHLREFFRTFAVVFGKQCQNSEKI